MAFCIQKHKLSEWATSGLLVGLQDERDENGNVAKVEISTAAFAVTN
jgi:hypothetical protein